MIIDVDNLDEAIAIAERLPPAKQGTAEIFPIETLPENTGTRQDQISCVIACLEEKQT